MKEKFKRPSALEKVQEHIKNDRKVYLAAFCVSVFVIVPS